jgi:hypothetical protein
MVQYWSVDRKWTCEFAKELNEIVVVNGVEDAIKILFQTNSKKIRVRMLFE